MKSNLIPCQTLLEDDILEGSNQISIEDRKEVAPKVDADFFNSFDDDLDESDMIPDN